MNSRRTFQARCFLDSLEPRLCQAAPQLLSVGFDIDVVQAGSARFSQNVSASLQASDFALTNLQTGAAVDPSRLTLIWNNPFNQVSVRVLGNDLADGDYRFSVLPAGISNDAGEPLSVAGGFAPSAEGFVLRGDANRDRSVDIADFAVLGANFGSQNGRWGTADFDYNGTIELADFAQLAANFGRSLALPAVRPQPFSTAPAVGVREAFLGQGMEEI